MEDMWSQMVKPSDHITHLGDVTMDRGGKKSQDWFIGRIRKLPGHKRLHLGNHDHFPIRTYLEAGFEKIYATWRDDSGLLFSHFPLHPRSLGSALAAVHGHTHDAADYEPVVLPDHKGNIVQVRPYINICVEHTGYMPIHYDQLIARIKQAKEDYREQEAINHDQGIAG